ncbi:MAG: glycosyltransferase family 4 protein [Methylomicrobium sp.]|nr:glycosyltransferase family 4 protein [Methylomicrobium sp.]
MPNNVLMIGQFPMPITGEGQMNLIMENLLSHNDYVVSKVNSCIIKDVNDVGKFSINKIFKSLKLSFISILKLFNTDILYATPGQTLFGLYRFLPIIISARLLHKKVILHWHGYGILDLFRTNKILSKLYFNNCFTNIVLTKDLKLKLKDIGINTSKTFNVANFCQVVPEKEVSFSSDKKLNVLYLGGLMQEKGIEILLDIITKTNDFNFNICGAGNNEITNRIEILSATNNLIFHGLVSGEEKKKVLEEADIFVLQTQYLTEGVPLTILEAMSNGCAIITTEHNGIPETVGAAAYFVKKSSVESLYNALIELNNDREKLHDLKVSAYERSKLFSYNNFKSEILDLFQSS